MRQLCAEIVDWIRLSEATQWTRSFATLRFGRRSVQIRTAVAHKSSDSGNSRPNAFAAVYIEMG